MRLAAVVALVLGTGAGSAAADQAPPAGEDPGCALLDRADGVNRAGAAIGWSALENNEVVDITALRMDLFGQWLHPDFGVGGYAVLPVSYARADPDAGATNAEWAIGDAELGAVARRTLAPTLDVAAHLGVTLPTAPEETFTAAEVSGFANSFAIWARPNDLVQAYPEASYLRLGLSPIHRSGHLFARADAAVDVPLHSGADEDLLTLGRLNAAVGAENERGGVMLELVDVIALEEPDNDGDDRVLSFLGLTGVFRPAAGWQISPSVLIPLDEAIRNGVDFAVLLGAQARLP